MKIKLIQTVILLHFIFVSNAQFSKDLGVHYYRIIVENPINRETQCIGYNPTTQIQNSALQFHLLNTKRSSAVMSDSTIYKITPMYNYNGKVLNYNWFPKLLCFQINKKNNYYQYHNLPFYLRNG